MSAEDDMPGSHAANQSKTESMPPSEGHADPDAAPEPATVEVPSLDSMSVGAGDPQAPSHAAAGEQADRAHSGVPALETRDDASAPAPGSAHRAPGSLGATGTDEQIETDVERSADSTNVVGTPGAASGAGDPQGVPVVSDEAAPGTSEDSAVAEGARTPE